MVGNNAATAPADTSPIVVCVDEMAELMAGNPGGGKSSHRATALVDSVRVIAEVRRLRADNEALRAELDAAEGAVTDLLHELESAHAAGYTSPPSIWWSA
jgi:hypothetical protein